MDKLNRYRAIIKNILSNLVEQERQYEVPGIEPLMIADDARDQYLLFNLGWSERRRVRQVRVFLRLLNDKIWIEEDLTEDGIATDLLEAGVPKEDIVLAFHAPEMRPYTEFAVA
jgi:hypothetical protein